MSARESTTIIPRATSEPEPSIWESTETLCARLGWDERCYDIACALALPVGTSFVQTSVDTRQWPHPARTRRYLRRDDVAGWIQKFRHLSSETSLHTVRPFSPTHPGNRVAVAVVLQAFGWNFANLEAAQRFKCPTIRDGQARAGGRHHRSFQKVPDGR